MGSGIPKPCRWASVDEDVRRSLGNGIGEGLTMLVPLLILDLFPAQRNIVDSRCSWHGQPSSVELNGSSGDINERIAPDVDRIGREGDRSSRDGDAGAGSILDEDGVPNDLDVAS